MSKPLLALWPKEDGTGRAYRHPWRLGADGKPLTSPSVTTCLKFEEKPDLVQWAADQTTKWAVVNWATLGSRSNEDAIKTARFRWRDVRDSRGEVGTGIHETIEALHTNSWDLPVLDAEQQEIMLEWAKLNEEWEIEPLLTEFTIWNFTEDYAGTGDGIWRFTNRLTGETFTALIDIKTSRNIWPGHWAQLAALAHPEALMVLNDPNAQQDSKGNWPKDSWSESEVLPFDRVGVVHLRAREWDEYGKVTKAPKHDLVWMPPEDMEAHWLQFKAYRELWGVDQTLKMNEKKRSEPKYDEF